MNFRLTRAVKVLAIACLGAFLVQKTIDQFFGGNLLSWLGLVPSAFAFQFRFWQLLTYSFLHADVSHLVLNLAMLVFVGAEIEQLWGTRRFLIYYFSCATAAGVFYLILQGFIWGGAGANSPLVGASGGIYGLLMAYGLLFAERTLLFMMVFPMKAKHFVWLLVGLEFLTTVFGNAPGQAFSGLAHLGGLFGGFLFLWGQAQLKIRARRKGSEGGSSSGGAFGRRRSSSRSAAHLKLVIDNDAKEDPKHKKSSGGRPSSVLSDDEDEGPQEPKTWH